MELRELRLIGYVRVSRVAGREGESFISPEVQRERIEAHAKAQGHTLVDVVEDMDQPGSRYDRPGFQEVLERVEAGEAHGVAVYAFDRFARSTVDAGMALRRLQEAGAELVSVRDNLDTSTSTGRFARTMMLAMAELELDRIRENWAAARDHAIARGVHICKVPPAGYGKGEDGRLELDPETSPTVRELFMRRAAGESWKSLCNFMNEELPRDSGGGWTHQTLDSIIRSRTYLGIAFAGDVENRGAHEPLVTRVEWDAAQAGKRISRRSPSGALLSGVLRCAACGYVMGRASDGARGYANYRCRGRHAAGTCPEPARISVLRADEYVEQEFLAWVERERLSLEATEPTDAVERAQTELDDAEAELSAYMSADLVSVVGEQRFREGAATRQRRVDDARAALSDARRSEQMPFLGAHDLAETWPTLSVDEKGRLLRAAIDAVVVRRAHLTGRAPMAADRVTILWRGEGPAELPGRGASFMRPFDLPDAPREVRVSSAH